MDVIIQEVAFRPPWPTVNIPMTQKEGRQASGGLQNPKFKEFDELPPEFHQKETEGTLLEVGLLENGGGNFVH